MKVTYYSHASLQLQTRNGLKLITDPWRHDPIYGNLLWLFPQNKIPLEQYVAQDVIFISHHHPDHFCPRTLDLFDKSIPVIMRKFDLPLFDFRHDVEALGFRTIIQLDHRETAVLADGTKITLLQIADGCDSALVVSDSEHTVFNQNDCFLPEADLAWVGENFTIDLAAAFFMGLGPFPGVFDLTREQKIAGVKERLRDCFARADRTLSLLGARACVPYSSDMTWLRQPDIAELCGALPIEFRRYMEERGDANVLLMNSGDVYSFSETPDDYQPAFRTKTEMMELYWRYRELPQNRQLIEELDSWERRYRLDESRFLRAMKDYCAYASSNRVTNRTFDRGISVGLRLTEGASIRREYLIRFYPERSDVTIDAVDTSLAQMGDLHMVIDLPDYLAAMAVTGANTLEDCGFRWLIHRPGAFSVAEGAFWDFINGFNPFLRSRGQQPEWNISSKFKQLSQILA